MYFEYEGHIIRKMKRDVTKAKMKVILFAVAKTRIRENISSLITLELKPSAMIAANP